jgi:hypothetical protein
MNYNWDDIPQSKKLHAPLRKGDSVSTTLGCRHTHPSICKSNELATVCAFVRSDGFCFRPPSSWKKKYVQLVEEKS